MPHQRIETLVEPLPEDNLGHRFVKLKIDTSVKPNMKTS